MAMLLKTSEAVVRLAAGAFFSKTEYFLERVN